MSAVVAKQQPPPAPSTLSKANTASKVKPPAPQSTAQTSPMSSTKSKKDASKLTNTAPAIVAAPKNRSQEQMKKVSRRASKPIINWFQRKLAGTVRARRPSESRYGTTPARSNEKQHRRSSAPMPPPLPIQSRTRSTTGSRHTRPHSLHGNSLRGTISLNEPADDADSHSYQTDSDDERRSSVARESLYSPASDLEADEDASVRPLPPSSPPSPSPSRDSSSYLSHSRTFRSMTASTKPTTLLSVDLTGGMAHIAQAPPTPTTPGNRLPPYIRTHSAGPSAGSITFSAIPPPSPTNHSRPSSGNGVRGANLTAPLYTTHHPRNNPRPSSPPPDNASMLTLASSAFGFPGARIGVTAVALSGRGSIADDSISQWSNAAGLTDSTSHFMMGELEEGLEEERYDPDVDASVRALRPRSSRRGSWDSTVSGWSANVGLGNAGAPSPGAMRSKSVWTSGSMRTGGLSTEDEFAGEGAKHDQADGESTTNDGASSAPTDGQQSSTTVEPSSDSTEDVQTPPALTKGGHASTLVLPGSKANLPMNMASTVTLPGSEVTSSDHASANERKSGASTPTKIEPDGAGLGVATAATEIRDKAREDHANRLSASAPVVPLSPTSPASEEYVSAPSTPAVV